MNLVFALLILCSSLFAISNSANVKRYYIMRDGYRETKSNHSWALNIIDTDFYYVQGFHITDEDVILPNEELLKASWKFQLNYTSGGLQDTLKMEVTYRRVGPLVECEQFRGGPAYYIPGPDGWTNVWDFIIVRPSLLQLNGTNNNGTSGVIRFQSQTSGSPHYDLKTEKSSGPGCRRVKEDIMTWHNVEKYFEPFLGSNPDRDDMLKLQLQFQIQFISRTDNKEAIKKYNKVVAEDRFAVLE